MGEDAKRGGDEAVERGDLDPNNKNPRVRQSSHFGPDDRDGGSGYHQGAWPCPSSTLKRKGVGIRLPPN